MRLRAALFCDASTQQGSGHVMRQITLGIALRARGCDVDLRCHEIPEALVRRANQFGLSVAFRNLAQGMSAVESDEFAKDVDIAVVDGYGFSAEAIEGLRSKSSTVVVVDDNGDHANAHCDVLLNQNLHATASMYEQNSWGPELLLGTNWALIRPEILEVRDSNVESYRKDVFVSVGGLDHRGLAPQIGHQLSDSNFFVRTAGGFGATGVLSPHEMALAMRSARVGVIACGTTTWEAACLGLPMVGLVVADNQALLAESIETAGLGRTFDCRESVDLSSIRCEVARLYDDVSECKRRSQLGSSLIDGFGAERVVTRILELVTS